MESKLGARAPGAARLSSPGQLAKVGRTCTVLCSAVKLELPDKRLTRLEALREFAEMLGQAYRKQTAYALEADGQDRIEALEKAVTHLKAYAAAQTGLSCPYSPMAWKTLDPQALHVQWEQASKELVPKACILHPRYPQGADSWRRNGQA